MASKGFTVPYGLSAQATFIGREDGLEAVIEYLAALEKYYEDGEKPEGLSISAQIIFGLARPTLDEIRERSASGKKGYVVKHKQAKHKLIEANDKLIEANAYEEEREERGEKKEEIPHTPLEEIKEAKEEREEVYTATVDNSIELSPFAVCAEPKIDSTPDPEPPVITFTLNTGTEYPVTQDLFAQLAELYPAVDTMQTLRSIKGWCISNPTKRKTPRGAKRFLFSWFDKEQNRGHPRAAPAESRPRRPTPEEIYFLPAIDPWTGKPLMEDSG